MVRLTTPDERILLDAIENCRNLSYLARFHTEQNIEEQNPKKTEFEFRYLAAVSNQAKIAESEYKALTKEQLPKEKSEIIQRLDYATGRLYAIHLNNLNQNLN